MGKWTEAAKKQKATLEAGQKAILDRLVIADENQMIVMGAIADLYEMLAPKEGSAK